MSVAKVIEISSESPEGFEAAIRDGIKRANDTLTGVKSAWIKEQQIEVKDGNVTNYRVHMLVTFILK